MSSNASFLVGEVARVLVTVADFAQAAADPGALRLKVRDPSGAVTTYTVGGGIAKDAVGAYHADVPLGAAGTWSYRWEADAPNAGAVEGQITVRRSALA